MQHSEPDTLEVLAGVAEWAAPFLRDTDVPVFGSPEWLALPLCDERRAAAVVRAALAWHRAGEPLEDVEARAEDAALKQAAVGVSAAGDWEAWAYRPTHAELARTRALPAKREEDYPGGPVAAW